MDPAENPFAPGAGTPPPALVGRDEQLEALRVLLARLAAGRPERSIVLCGLRGMGKTALLREMHFRARESEWRASYVEARSGLDVRLTFIEQALEQLAGLSIAEKAAASFNKALSFIKALRAAVTPGGVQIDVDPALLAPLGHSLEADLGALLSRLGEFAQAQGIGVVFFCDELQELNEDGMEALCAAMHRVTQERLPIALVAAGLPSLPGRLATAKSYAERLFAYPVVGPLSDGDARSALTTPLPPGIEIDADALEDLVNFAEGYPLLLQLVGKHAWDMADGPQIGRADVERAKPAAFESLSRELFLARWQRATPRERDYLRAIAKQGGQTTSGDAARGAGYTDTTAAGPARDQLISKGLLWAPERGQIAFTIPLFERFILDQPA
jgi:AAA ATPase domain